MDAPEVIDTPQEPTQTRAPLSVDRELDPVQERLRAQAATIDMPTFTLAETYENNLLARRRTPLITEAGMGKLSIWPIPPFMLASWTGSWARLEVVIADRLAMVHVPLDILLRITSERFPDLPFDGLEPRLRALILEFLFTPLLKTLEGAFQAPVRIGEIICPLPLTISPDFTFRFSLNGGQEFPIGVTCSALDQKTVSLLINNMEPNRQRPKDLSIPVSLRAGYASFALTDMSELDVGAGIILDGTYLTFQKIAAVTGEAFVQTCTWQSLKPVLDGPLLRRADINSWPFTTGASMSSGFSDDSNPPFGTVRDVPVHIVFELGRVNINVNELETLGQGYVFDLGRPLSQAVDILSGGRRIGSGELVRIADSIGVRITQIAT